MKRETLPPRRQCETFEFTCAKFNYTASIGYYPDGRVGEIFLSAGKAGTELHTSVRDAAIAVSFALQHGATIEQVGTAFTRTVEGSPEGPLGVLFDILAGRPKAVP